MTREDNKHMQMTTPVKVKVKLRQGQFTGTLNKWICTIHGEVREVPMQQVEWYCMSVEDAAMSLKPSEVDSFEIVGRYENPIADPF